ncbi:MAG TPA: hypothetical protein VLD37_06575, partial [Candidatus Bilamarchaeum sp.]|nr:hypothetical protein [Candidatus Bilamarchaeum sp.]
PETNAYSHAMAGQMNDLVKSVVAAHASAAGSGMTPEAAYAAMRPGFMSGAARAQAADISPETQAGLRRLFIGEHGKPVGWGRGPEKVVRDHLELVYASVRELVNQGALSPERLRDPIDELVRRGIVKAELREPATHSQINGRNQKLILDGDHAGRFTLNAPDAWNNGYLEQMKVRAADFWKITLDAAPSRTDFGLIY